VPIGHAAVYAGLVEEAGATDLLRQATVDRAGHCSFSVAEMLAALDVIVERADSGRWPATQAASLDSRARALGDTLQVVPPSAGAGGLPQLPAFIDEEPTPLPRA
jgi:hypothetical protein